MSADNMEPGLTTFAACPTCGVINIQPVEIAESRPFIGFPVPTSDEIDNDPRYADLLLLEPRSQFDRCIIGVARRFNDRFVLYSEEAIITELMAEDPDDPSVPLQDQDAYSRALEHYEFNIAGGYVGEHTPAFLEGEING